MAKKQAAAMPSDLDIVSGWKIQFAAVDPTTGAGVAGVNVSGAAIIAAQLEGTPEALAVAPLWVPIPLGDSSSAAGG